jgi:DNA-binding transcriptional LysR family regulator
VVAETGDFSVAAGVGVALVPRLGVQDFDDLVLRPLLPALERRILVAARGGSDDHPLNRAVVDAIT